jgi:lipopolysaccharide/colanic/teichoic acid biosynthesis glycosyltransferase
MRTSGTNCVSRIASPPPPLTHATGPNVSGVNSSPSSRQVALPEGLRQVPIAKRLFDVLAAAAALLIFAPVLAALALIVRLAIGAPILYKFRTMSDARHAAECFLPDAERLGSFGRFLRSTSLDELPELINVLRGEMSLVDPRPLLMEYLPRYSAERCGGMTCSQALLAWRRSMVKEGMLSVCALSGGKEYWYSQKQPKRENALFRGGRRTVAFRKVAWPVFDFRATLITFGFRLPGLNPPEGQAIS